MSARASGAGPGLAYMVASGGHPVHVEGSLMSRTIAPIESEPVNVGALQSNRRLYAVYCPGGMFSPPMRMAEQIGPTLTSKDGYWYWARTTGDAATMAKPAAKHRVRRAPATEP